MHLLVCGCSTKRVVGSSRRRFLVWRAGETYIACLPRPPGSKRISLTGVILSLLVSLHGTTCPGGRLASAPNRSGSMFGLRLFREARTMHEPPAATADMVVLPGVLGSRTLRRTNRYASGPSPCGCPVARPSPRSRHGVSCIMRARGAAALEVCPRHGVIWIANRCGSSSIRTS
jgi:hypothetical protein